MTNRPPAPRRPLVAIVLVLLALIIAPVAAADVKIIPELPYTDVVEKTTAYDYKKDFKDSKTSGIGGDGMHNLCIYSPNIQNWTNLIYVCSVIPTDIYGSQEGTVTVYYRRLSDNTVQPAVLYLQKGRNALGNVVNTRLTLFPQNWEIGDSSGVARINLYADESCNTPYQLYCSWIESTKDCDDGGSNFIGIYTQVSGARPMYNHLVIKYAAVGTNHFKNTLSLTPGILPTLNIDKHNYYSEISADCDGNNIFKRSGTVNINEVIPTPLKNITISLKSPSTDIDNLYIYTPGDPGDPGDPGETPTLRTGTVTMTDNNGTTITGFEVTAVNHYTGEEYNVSTESDVAVITLPMDRTIEIRNPQTGEYEEAPVGYYRFYGQAPGYKMLNEDGIKVSVMPEKYGSYQLCDILVTSESGYLTGKHQFQIRSRSDNSILQTGTLSAKSATTGEWYNTTVSDGIATLILVYDTSNPISQYAGNYYVYATSPGYQDSEYGTQIVVMPHTTSEIKSILLTPIGGVPPAGNVTLRIQAFSEYGPGVANATIFIAGVLGAGSDVWDTYTASSTGYLAVSVPGNSTYDIVASAEGYYDSARRIEVFTEAPGLIEMKLYLSGAPTVEPTTQPTGWPTTQPTTQPPGGIPDEDDDSEGFLMQAVRGIGLAFGVGFATAKLIFGMLLALSIGYATAKQLRGGAAEFGLGLLGGTLLGVLIGLLPVWIIVVLLLVVGLYIGNRYVGGGNNG